MGNEENQKQVSLVSHSPWKSLSRFPHSHSPGDYREEKWKSNSRIPTFPSQLSIVLKIQKRRIPLNAGFPSFRLIVRLEYAQILAIDTLAAAA
jgi:hypothetical protein